MVNEKTLELNVSAELVEYFRIFDPKCYLKGLTLRKEHRRGWDVRVSGFFTFFQFKAPRVNGIFSLNRTKSKDQHSILFNLCRGQRGIAYYVFPYYRNENELSHFSPHMLQNTYFADIAKIGDLPKRIHSVELDLTRMIAMIYSSEIRKVDLISGKTILEYMERTPKERIEDQPYFDPVLKSKGLSSEALSEAIPRIFMEEGIRSKSIGTRSIVRPF